MANIKITGIPKVTRQLRQELIKSLREKELRKDIGDIVAQETAKKPQGSPARNTVKARKRLEKYNRTSKHYKRSDINMHFTGELIEDMKNSVQVKTTGKKVEYHFNNSSKKHKKYKSKKGRHKGKRSSYKDILKGLKGHGYDYVLGDSKKISSLVKKHVIESLRKKFKV